MKHNYFIILLFLLISCFGFAQQTILCPKITASIKIENPNNVPIVSDNGDGTITLTHTEQYITDIFSNYLIYEFYQYSPNSNPNGELFKHYTIAFQNKDLINDLNTNVPISIIESFSYSSTPLSSDLINFLDGKQFRYSKYCSDIPEASRDCAITEQIIEINLNLIVSFTFDQSNDILKMTSKNLTPCGNSFEIEFKGALENDKLQIWKTTLETVTQNESCDNSELFFNDFFNILCIYGYSDWGIDFSIDMDSNLIKLGRPYPTFSHDFITFEERILSTEDVFLNDLKFYQTKNSPYLQVKNIQNKEFYVEITSINGKTLHTKKILKDNNITINTLTSGIYFIKTYNPSSNQTKVFKFLKQ
ncbi:hypothetical protein GCM10023314_20200 [Algibacter agarivorans]|uniref:Secretion system C-terminal sorting domain-containing protein n=1 Tax=Algibacter agarivorans TaxID=1109741 RepID=A0ABP9GLB0_9FLAO